MSDTQKFSLVKVMGERNSGTSFLAELLRLNFQVEILPNASPASVEQKALIDRIPKTRRRPGMITERIQDDNHLREMAWNAGWKHACLTDRVFTHKNHAEQTLFLCVLRHPALWLRSMLDRPFHNFSSRTDDLDEFLQTPWVTRSRDEVEEVVLESPVLLWRLKVESYLDQAEKRRNVHVVRHEDLLRDHKAQLVSLSGLLNTRKRVKWRIPKGYSRKWMRHLRLGQDFWAIKDALPEDPFTLLSPKQAETVRAWIGEDLLARAGYGGKP